MSLININRPLLPSEHHELRTHMPEINRLGDLGVKWRRFGEVGLMLVEPGEYQRIIEMKGAELAGIDATAIAATISSDVSPNLSTQKGRLTARIYDVRFLDTGRYPSIAYMLDSTALEQERAGVTAVLDHMNHKNGNWPEFEPHLSVATIEPWGKSDNVLQAFYDISPEEVTLLPVAVDEA